MHNISNDEETYKNIVESIKGIAFKLNIKGEIMFLNTAWISITGYSLEEGLGRNIINYIHPDDRKRIVNLNKSLIMRKQDYYIEEIRLLKKNNEYIYVEIFMKILLDKSNKLLGIIGNMDNITEKKFLKKQLQYKNNLLKKEKEKNRYILYYDSLTKLPNSNYLKKIFRNKKLKAKLNNENLSLIYIDLNKFKNINDTLGYSIGNCLLMQVSNKLKQSLNKTNNVIVRINGDEFAILFNFKDKQEINNLLEGILKLFNSSIKAGNQEVFISISAGISIYSKYCNSLEKMLESAETAMHRVKSQGKSSYEYFDKNMNIEDMRVLTIENELRKAIDREEFFLLYQPRVDTVKGDIRGVEALIRWNNPRIGIVYPLEFISIAEETGLIVPIGEWVLRESCKQAKIWHEMGHKINISVNISARQFQEPNFVKVVKSIIDEEEIDPRFLELEITENSIMKNIDKSVETIKELKETGADIAIDDFGTGFSSLSYIKRFEPNTLKIDKTFIKDIPKNENDISITLAIINMTQSLKIRTVAEGVETKEQLKLLKENNCDEIQGYLFSKPTSVEKINEMLSNKML